MLFRSLNIVLLSIVLFGCDTKSLSIDFKSSSSLSGKIDLANNSTSNVKLCAEYTVSLYVIDENGNQQSEPLAVTTAEADGSYTFESIGELGVETRNQRLLDSYVIEATGCSKKYSRAATGVTHQDISVGSTFLSYVLGTDAKGSFASVLKEQPDKLETILGQIKNISSFDQAYSRIDENNEAKEIFISLFNISLSQLENAAPQIQSLDILKNIPEMNVSNFIVVADHWKSSYVIAYRWKWDGVSEAHLSTYSKTPGKNAQGEHVLTLLVGQDNGSGQVDLTKPYREKSFLINVANNFLPVAPGLSLTSGAETNNDTVTLEINTGAALANCSSFSTMAITENQSSAPEESAFIYSCTNVGTQTISYGLQDLSNGSKVLRLWAKDASGTVSSSAQSVTLNYDTTAPSISISAPATNSEFQSTFTISGACEGTGTVSVSGDVLSPASFSCSSGSFSESITLSAGEGNKSITLTQVDAAGNSGNTSRTVVRDNTAPSLSVSSPADGSVHQSVVPVAGNCETGLTVNFTGSGVSGGSFSGSCSGGSFAENVPMSAGQGAKAITVSQSDEAGNTTNIAKSYNRDSVAPVITQTGVTVDGSNVFKSNGDSVTWSGSCENNEAIEVTGEDTQSISCSSGSWSYDVVDKGIDGTYTYSFEHVDQAGNSSSITVHWVRNTTKPVLSFMQINDGSASTTSNFLQLDATASDSFDNITHLCFKYNDNSAPAGGASCWVPVNNPSPGLAPSQNISFTDYSFPVGLAVSSYTVSVWMKDELGNISDNSQSDGTDQATIFYDPGTPPEVQGLIASSNDSPNNPLQSVDTNIAVSNDVYIKWKAFDAEALHTTPVDLYYSTNDTNYTLIASNLTDGANGACTPDDGISSLDDGYTGCYLWSGGAPSNNYFSVRIVLRDDSGATSIVGSNPVNSSAIKVLAGNTSSAVGIPASTSILFNEFSGTQPDVQSFVVNNNGDIYFKDNIRGILKINNSTGIVDVFIAKNTSASGARGDGGAVSAAEVKDPVKLALSYDNKLLVFDYDRIRAVDLSQDPPTIDTFIGGGSLKADNIDPLDMQIASLWSESSDNMSFPFLPLPNGDLIFQSENYNLYEPEAGHRLRYFDASANKIFERSIGGIGNSYNSAQDISLCNILGEAFSFDPTTSNINYGLVSANHRMVDANCTHPSSNTQLGFSRVDSNFQAQNVTIPPAPSTGHSFWQKMITGRDGNIYSVGRDNPRVQRYNPVTNSWVSIYGNGNGGECNDGTVATSCQSMVSDIFVTSTGQIYVFDGRRIRLIDNSGNVVSIAGQSFSSGDGLQPLVSRFGTLDYIQKTDAGEYIVLDSQSYRIRSFTDSGTIETIAGNGQNLDADTSTAANISSFWVNDHSYSTGFFVNKASGDIYTSYKRHGIGRLNRGTGLWEHIVGSGGTRYEAADGMTGSNIYLDGYSARVFGMGNNEIVVGLDSWTTYGPIRSLLKSYDLTTTVQSHFLGLLGVPSWDDDAFIGDWADGTALDGQYLVPPKQLGGDSMTEIQYDSFDDYWLVANRNKSNIRILDRIGNQVQTLTTVSNGSIKNFVRVRDAGLTVNLIYYCSSNGKIYKKDLNTNVETQLNWTISSITCQGSSMVYDSVKDSLIFIFRQNQLYGVAEYQL